jgi:kinesin family protein 5
MERSSTMSSSSSPPLSPEEGEAEFIKVYLRLRPKNKLETMKRGKDCIELHDDPRMITCDSPKLGEIKFNFNHVFDEQTTQEEIYRECVSNIPTKLLEGYNATVLAYGQKGSGKTHSLIGEGLGVELTALVSPSYSNDDDNNNDESMIIEQDPNNVSSRLQRKYLDPKRHPNKTAGIIPRVVAHLFDLLYESTSNDSSIEFSIRCSFVEIYLDKMTDLLQPNRRGEYNSGLRVGRTSFCCGTTNEACIVGATELCCVCPEDVYTILSRGQALRTKAATDACIDSSRSHTIFTLHLEQIDKCSGALSRSRLQILDIAGNQCRPIPKLKDNAPATIVEKRMINASLASFHRLVQLTLQQQKQKSLKSSSSEPISSSAMSKLAKILQPSIGGNTHTVMICTGSPSSYSIDDTIETIRFAQQIQKVYNTPRVAFESYTQESYRMELFLAERRQQEMTRLIRLLAQECKHGKKKSREPKNPKVWEAVLQIVEDDKNRNENNNEDDGTQTNNIDDNLHISLFEEGEKEKEIRDLRVKLVDAESKLQQEQIAREKIESAFRDTRSEIVSLKSQVESFTKYKQTIDQELSNAKAQINKISTQKTEVDYLLRTSQFRENEAILFLRQLRTFYFRLLKNKAAHGSGGTRDVIEEAKTKMPGIADLEDLLDIDRMLIKSGIIENSEIGGDTPISDYSPSENALARSALEARKVEEREMELINKEIEEESQDQYSSYVSTGLTRGQLISYRQKIVKSPAGVLAIQKEKDLEIDFLQLSKKCIGLQNSLNAEKSMVQALAGRQGAMTKMKQIQATITLKTELERRTNDLLAIVWKMNELHLVNKTIDAKAVIREQKCSYLSEYLLQLQTKNKRFVSQTEDDKKRLRDDNSDLRNQLEGMSLSLWQLGEHLEKAPIWRYSVPVSFSGELMDFDDDETNLDRRLYDGNLTEEEINGLIEIVQCSD